ncbi:MAG: hypothetical protein LBO03_01420 [Acidaminococcales bacterium]|jgi:hypothetical protein|nr:hypothetical protein [Acidaminococcales bacterium]
MKEIVPRKIFTVILCFLMVFANIPLTFADGGEDEEETPPTVMRKASTVRTVKPGNIYIPDKTPVEVELVNNISSKTHKKGHIVDIRVIENLIVNGVVVIPKGALGQLLVTEAHKAGGFGKRGKLVLTPQFVFAANNEKIPLIPDNYQTLGKGDGGAVAVAAAVTLIGGIFMKGSNTTFNAGTEFTVAVDGDIDLGCTEENLADEMDPSKVRGNEIKVVAKS